MSDSSIIVVHKGIRQSAACSAPARRWLSSMQFIWHVERTASRLSMRLSLLRDHGLKISHAGARLLVTTAWAIARQVTSLVMAPLRMGMAAARWTLQSCTARSSRASANSPTGPSSQPVAAVEPTQPLPTVGLLLHVVFNSLLRATCCCSAYLHRMRIDSCKACSPPPSSP